MASLSEDLRVLAYYQEPKLMAALAGSAENLPEDLQKINWQRLVCFAIPMFNRVAPFYGLPPLPVPAFCTNPVPPTPPTPVG